MRHDGAASPVEPWPTSNRLTLRMNSCVNSTTPGHSGRDAQDHGHGAGSRHHQRRPPCRWVAPELAPWLRYPRQRFSGSQPWQVSVAGKNDDEVPEDGRRAPASLSLKQLRRPPRPRERGRWCEDGHEVV